MNPLFQALSQTWPARAVKGLYEAAKHPGEVYAGRSDPMDVEKATDLAGLAMTGGLGGLGGMSRQGVVGSGPIRAYHGSPHDFDRFDLSKIGTGEGAQAYGHGLYFAENEGVARAYRKVLSDGLGGKVEIDPALLAKEPRLRQVFKEAETTNFERGQDPVTAWKEGLWSNRFPDITKAINEGIEGGAIKYKQPGNMYEVAIHADPERFLDWDAPLKEQAAPVKQAIERMGMGDYLNTSFKGGQIAPGPGGNLPAFVEAGLPGLKYLDQGSRTAGDGSRNYVTFSDNIVEILRKYGLVGGLGGLGGMQAMQEPRT